jgi:hypothetical protein
MKTIDCLNEQEKKALLRKTMELDFDEILKNHHIINLQLKESSTGYSKCRLNQPGISRLIAMGTIYEMALFLKRDASGPRRWKAEVLF